MYETTVDERGRVTIPKDIRTRFGLSKGTQVEFDVRSDGIVMTRKSPAGDPVWQVFGRLNKGIDVDGFITEMRD